MGYGANVADDPPSTPPAIGIEAIERAAATAGDLVRHTPLLAAGELSRRFGAPVSLKAECLQRTGSFKVRGAANAVAALGADRLAGGVCAASAGNHAQAVTVAAGRHGAHAELFMPVSAPLSKVAAVRGHGGNVRLVDGGYDEAQAAALAYAEQTGTAFIHAFDDPAVVAGQGTVGLEIAGQAPATRLIVVPLGGGGLAAGIGIAASARLEDARVVGVQAEACAPYPPSLEARTPLGARGGSTICDGIAVKQPGRLTLPLVARYVDEVVTVSDDEVAEAMVLLLERSKLVVEGAGAVAVAAILHGKVDAAGRRRDLRGPLRRQRRRLAPCGVHPPRRDCGRAANGAGDGGAGQAGRARGAAALRRGGRSQRHRRDPPARGARPPHSRDLRQAGAADGWPRARRAGACRDPAAGLPRTRRGLRPWRRPPGYGGMSTAAYEDLRARLGEIADLGRATSLLFWDSRTHMPRTGAEPRAEHLATLTGVAHERMVSDQLGRLLEGLEEWGAAQPYESDEASTVRMALRNWRKAKRVPTELATEIAAAESLAESAWEEARGRSDFAAMLPHVKKLVELKRRLIECFDDHEHPYDVLLDDFEPGMTVAQLRPVFTELRDGLTGLLERISSSGVELDDSCLHGEFDLARQRALGTALCELLPLRPGGWRLDETAHPFASAMAPSDLRLTTRYEPGFIGTTIWAIVHEAGHGIYESGMPDALRRTPIGEPPSLGLHESQSRLWENWVGRGRPFVRALAPILAEHFPDQFGAVDPEALYRAANKVQRSLIRVEADEVTYNLHIAIRFELEVAIFEETLGIEELPEAWNARYSEYLGLEVPNDADGVLQDVHWYGGAFGYFPTYSLGNVVAAQLWNAATAELSGLDAQLEAGELEPLRAWLDERLYSLAGRFEPTETIERATGGGLDVKPLLEHLETKYGELYEL